MLNQSEKTFEIRNLDGKVLFSLTQPENTFQNTLNQYVSKNPWGASTESLDLRNQDLSNCEFPDRSFRRSDFSGANLESAQFINCDLSRTLLREARIWGCKFDKSNLKGADLFGVNADCASFDDANLQGADLSYGSYRFAYFSRADLRCADFVNSTFYRNYFDDALINTHQLPDLKLDADRFAFKSYLLRNQGSIKSTLLELSDDSGMLPIDPEVDDFSEEGPEDECVYNVIAKSFNKSKLIYPMRAVVLSWISELCGELKSIRKMSLELPGIESSKKRPMYKVVENEEHFEFA